MSEKRKAMLAEAMKAELRQKLAATQQQLAEEQVVRERLSRDYANSVHQISVLDTALKRSLAEQAAKVCILLVSACQSSSDKRVVALGRCVPTLRVHT
jgi:hypothetical protein